MTPSPTISVLLTEAQRTAANKLGPVEATPATLEKLAGFTRLAVIGQVLDGAWRDVGVTEYDHIAGLSVTARLGNQMIGEPAIKVEFDFSKTLLRSVVVEARASQ